MALRLTASRKRYGETAIRLVLMACAAVSVLTTIGIVAALLQPTIEFFREVGVGEFLTGTDWSPLFSPSSFGVLPLVVGTLTTTFWACLVALPFGLGAAIYMSEYAGPRARRWLKPALEVLAGIPTVVYGYFALTFVTPFLQDLGLPLEVFNALAAGLVMGVMILPTVASLSDDAMTAVPMALREGAYGLGASKLQVSTRVVVPAALSGIVASFVLGISRAVGETMIMAIAAGAQPTVTFNPYEAVQTMTAYIAQVGIGDVPTGSLEYKTIFAVGATLFVMTFVMNLISIRLVRRFREVYE
ncbi:MAG: phosphate ABC transporter permease subunit PstC [Solirubrobacterales bacterium]